MALVESEGFDGLTMQRLAAEVDLTPGALYRYFRSKDAIVVAMQGRALEEIGALIEAERGARAALDDPKAAILADIVGAAMVYGHLRDRAPRIYHLVGATLADPRTLVDDAEAHLVADPMRHLLGRVAASFQAAAEIEALEPGDAVRRTVVFWSAIQGVMSVAKLDRLAPRWFSTHPLLEELLSSLLRGWGAPPEPLALAVTHCAGVALTGAPLPA